VVYGPPVGVGRDNLTLVVAGRTRRLVIVAASVHAAAVAGLLALAAAVGACALEKIHSVPFAASRI
jgi:hypothetical protein